MPTTTEVFLVFGEDKGEEPYCVSCEDNAEAAETEVDNSKSNYDKVSMVKLTYSTEDDTFVAIRVSSASVASDASKNIGDASLALLSHIKDCKECSTTRSRCDVGKELASALSEVANDF